MATIKYILQGKPENSQIYLRLSLSKTTSFKRKTGYFIKSKDWSKSTGLPKPNNPFNKNLKVDLMDLEVFIIQELNNSNTQGVEIKSSWLEKSILKHLGKSDNTDLDYLIPYTEKYIQDLKFNTNKKGKKGVSESTIKKRITILNKLRRFQSKSKNRYKVKDVDLDFRKRFIEFLDKEDNLSDGTIGRYLKEVKTICFDAQKNDITVSSQLVHFKGFSSESHKTYLTFEEIKQIEETNFEDKDLATTRDWLVIGCYTGQRVSDLMRMNKSMIKKHHGYNFIELTQKKTGKLVQIPVHDRVENILNSLDGDFPKVFSSNEDSNSAIFNKHLKKVCEEAGLNEEVKGKLRNPETERLEEGFYPKYKLVSSHICRRSFATNFYSEEKYPTPILMNVTGHSTEKMFLSYIGKKSIDYGLQLAKVWGEKT